MASRQVPAVPVRLFCKPDVPLRLLLNFPLFARTSYSIERLFAEA